jgi:hypothetical protein
MPRDDGDRSEPPRREVTGRLSQIGPDERAFDDAFWRSIPPHQRVEALWDMVLESLAVKGIHVEPRLQRSVGSIRRQDMKAFDREP